MKLIISSLTLALLLSGCTQPKNRLADEKNLDFQKRMAAKKPQTQPSETVVIDVKPPVTPPQSTSGNGTESVAASPAQQPQIQLPPPVEPAEEPRGGAPAPAATPAPRVAAPAAPANAAPAQRNNAPAAAPTGTPATTQDKSILSEEEQAALYKGLAENGINSREAFQELFTTQLGDIKSPSLSLGFKDEAFSAQIKDGDKVVTQFENAKLDKSGKAVQLEALNGFKVTLICSSDCRVVFFGVSKEENGRRTINLPAVLKLVDGSYVMAKARPQQAAQQAAPPAAAAPPATAAATDGDVFVEFDELGALYATFQANNFGSQDDISALFTGIYAEPDNLGFKVEGNAEEFSLQATNGPKVITEVKKMKLDKSGKILVVESSNGFRLITMCAKDCSLVYASFIKVAGENLEANLPLLLKNVNGQFKPATLRSAEHYKAEAEKTKAAAAAK
jgi:hypothetical protein